MPTPRDSGMMLDRRQIGAVRESLRHDLGAHPEWADLWNLHGLLEAYEGNLEKARSSFAEALRRNATYRAALANRAWLELIAGGSPADTDSLDHPTIIAAVRLMLHDLPPRADWADQDPAAAFFSIALAARDGNGAAVEEGVTRLRALLPGVDDLLDTAELTTGQGMDARALADLGRAERMNPGFSDLLRRAGRIESLTGRDREALRLHALSALLEGGKAAFLVEKAEIASRSGGTDEVLALLVEAAASRPDWAPARATLGYELSRRGRATEALEHFREAARLEPRWADVQYQQGLLFHACGKNEEAMRAMEAALAINPSYVVARIALANLLFESHRAGDAAPHYERVFEDGMDTPFLAGRFGYSLHAAGDRNRAEELFLDAIAKGRNRPELLALYGQFLAETDRRLEARTVWERALATNPPDRVRAEIETMRSEVSVEDRRHDP
ncbi:MAG: hypothetical protein U0167_12860 [bacterium]